MPCSRRKLYRQLRIVQQQLARIRQSYGIVLSHQQTGIPVVDHFGDSSHIGRNARGAKSHCLKQHRWESVTIAIDAAGTLPSGQSFKGAKQLSAILKTREPEFRRCLSEKMLTYALGRGLEYYDKCALDDICAQVGKGENRFSSMVLAIVKSEPFQLRKGRGVRK